MNSALLQLLLSLLCATRASAIIGLDQEQDGDDGNSTDNTGESTAAYYQIISSALAAITAWNVLVVVSFPMTIEDMIFC